MILFPNAKINLGLNVVEKRSDGFHNIETVFYPIKLSDALDVVESKEFQFTISGIKIGGNTEENLVVKAYRILEKEFGLPPVQIHIHKVIPVGAGLGGGSSDAAHMLILLNNLFNLKQKKEELEKYASLLGADCPFFVRNSPCFASGIGNIFSPVNLNLSNYKIIIVKPPFAVGTSEAYQNIIPQKSYNSLYNTIRLPISEWQKNLKNDFEKPIFRIYPEIKEIKAKLYDLGALYSSMSGSGSAVFAIFRHLPIKLETSFPESYFIYR